MKRILLLFAIIVFLMTGCDKPSSKIVINKKVTAIDIDPEEIAKEIHSLEFQPRKIDAFKKIRQMSYEDYMKVHKKLHELKKQEYTDEPAKLKKVEVRYQEQVQIFDALNKQAMRKFGRPANQLELEQIPTLQLPNHLKIIQDNWHKNPISPPSSSKVEDCED